MIEYHYELSFKLENEGRYSKWITDVVHGEDCVIERLSYIFCDDTFLLELNRKYLNHDTLTDILTFPYNDSIGLKGEIYISIDRVRENADALGIDKSEELRRVMIHGVLHLLGHQDGTKEQKNRMRNLEDSKIRMFHVEQ